MAEINYLPLELREEQGYLTLMKEILEHGRKTPARNGNTLSLFAKTIKFRLFNKTPSGDQLILPLLTTKKMSLRVIAEELFFFLRGQTDTKILHENNVKIWDANTSRETLDKLGFTEREEGDAGPIYGFQWRHFGAPYSDCHANYTNQGVDQITQLIHNLRTNPYDRRHIVTAWNPAQIPEMALPPCHMIFQFDVEPCVKTGAPKYLNCLLFQRSADVPLGVPYNIASYALLTHIIGHMTNLTPNELTITLGNAHIYANQVENCHVQLARTPYAFPTLNFAYKPHEKIEDYCYKDLLYDNYQSHEKLDFPFST